jgi:hypothetical protein
MPKYGKLLSLAVLLFISSAAVAKEVQNPYTTPLAIGIFPPVQFPPSKFDVTGLRLSLLMGRHRNTHGIDLAVLGNRTDQDFGGLALAGGFNYIGGRATIIGLQAAIGANINKGEAKVYGLQLALANIGKHTEVNGIQFGLYNRAHVVRGFQIGLVNVTNALYGIQLGLANYNDSGRFRMTPLINFGW